MASKKYQVGAEIEGWCAKCKLDRTHAIETLKSDGNINRVICRTCESSHRFRRPQSEAGKARSASAAAKRRRKSAPVITEEELAKAKTYKLDGVFEVGDVIRHKKFGNGRVLELRGANKMEVGFDDGAKLMVCGDR